ncbi:MAG: division/cell wall cluster transcriptional repressor MraZ [Terracidiphilus sp.]|jgi:MraZ protein
MAMFRGNHPAKVDPKGRLKLPAGFKERMEGAQITQFFITSSNGKSAQIWPLPEWEKQEALLDESSTMDEAVEKYLNFTSYFGQQVGIDGEGRVLLPQILRQRAKLDGEVAIIGKPQYLEVFDQMSFEESLLANPITASDRESLKVTLKPRS